MRSSLIFILLLTTIIVSGCGTVGGAINGIGNDLVDLMKFSYKIL